MPPTPLPTGTPDACLVPPDLADRLGPERLYADLCRTLGGRLHFGLDAHLQRKFGRLDPHQTRLHPGGHPLARKDRYDWFVARKPEGQDRYAPALPFEDWEPLHHEEVLLGYLRPDPHAEDPAVKDAMKRSLDGRIAAALKGDANPDA